MTTTTQPASGFMAIAFGAAMVTPLAVGGHGPAVVAAVLAAVAVVVGIRWRAAATAAVLAAIAAIVLSDAPPLVATLCGFAAAAYLVTRHAAGGPGLVTATQPAVVGAVGFTIAGLAAMAFPFRLPWLPLLAPLAVLAIYALATRPFWIRSGRE